MRRKLAVHFGMVVLLVEHVGATPLAANVVGWLVAFVVSFAGQHRLTFADRSAPLLQAAPRFFAISAGGFATNEAAYALLLPRVGDPVRRRARHRAAGRGRHDVRSEFALGVPAQFDATGTQSLISHSTVGPLVAARRAPASRG